MSPVDDRTFGAWGWRSMRQALAIRLAEVRGAFRSQSRGHARGAPVGPFASVAVQIDARRQREGVLRRKVATLEAEDRRKDLALATVGHELRNPLAALDLELRLLQDGAADVDRIHSRMGFHVRRITSLASELFELSRMTNAKLELHKVPTDLVALVRLCAEGIASGIREKRQDLVLRLPARLHVEADPDRLAQIASNLISNASRCTPEGGRIEVTVERDGEEAVLSVLDTGLGLRPEQLESVFEPFVQAHGPGEGLGIGLALAKGLVELHGGTVAAHSHGPGQGCVFTVRVPVGAVRKRPLEEGRRTIPRLSRVVRVLVVDDHREFADSLALLLDRMGARTRCAYTGVDGLSAAATWRPDVMLIDLGLADMKGNEVAQSIRSGARGGDVLLVAVTGFSGDGSAATAATDAGFNDMLVKPVDADRMHQLLEQWPAPSRSPLRGGGKRSLSLRAGPLAFAPRGADGAGCAPDGAPGC